MQIVQATVEHIPAIVQLHLKPEQYANKYDRAYLTDKVRMYVEHPDAVALIAQDEDSLLGFILVSHHDDRFRHFCRSPRVLTRVAWRHLTGAYGFSLMRFCAQLRITGQRFHNYGDQIAAQDIAMPDAWLGSLHTDPRTRQSHPGALFALLRAGETWLEAAGCEYWGGWTSVENKAMLRVYRVMSQTMGYHIRCVIPRIGEDCYLITNQMRTLNCIAPQHDEQETEVYNHG